MTDRITQCDVVDCCEDCPRYADDCDGDKYLDRYPTMHEYAEGKRINPKLRELISKADAIETVASITMSIHLSDVICDKLMALPSADAEPTVIRSKTLLPTKDFKEWAKRVRETNPNVIVIPCDAEVVSADAVQGWIPLNKQKSFLMMPDELVAVNVTWVNHIAPPYYKHIEDVPFVDTAVYYRGKWYWWDATVIDVLAEYGEDCNAEQIDKDIEILAWMPLPTPYKGGDTE